MALLYLLHDLRSIRQLVDQRLDDPEHRFGLRCCCLLHSAKQGKPGQVPFSTGIGKKAERKQLLCYVIWTWWSFKSSSYWGAGCESPLRRFMTSVPRIMARLVRPTPTWQLKRRAGSRRDASWPRDKLVLSWKTENTEWTLRDGTLKHLTEMTGVVSVMTCRQRQKQKWAQASVGLQICK